MSKAYDTIVIGAGIAGCMAAYVLQQKGQRVLLVDRAQTPATGGSGAAGAFVSPKIGKGGSLQQLTNEAFAYAKAFYLEHFSDYFHQTGVIRIPKDDEDAQKFPLYEPHNDAAYRKLDPTHLHQLGIKESNKSFLFKEAGVCDAPELCKSVADKVPFRQFDVTELVFEGERWTLLNAQHSTLNAQYIVLATGYRNDLIDIRYMGVRGTWGSRGDYYADLPLKVSMHKKISVSANIGGIIKLGATHVKAKDPCMVCDGRPLRMLEEQAAQMVDTGNFRLKETFCGMRAGSKDYFPLVGNVVDVPWMQEYHPTVFRGARVPLKHYDNLYVLNGLGGRGFVFAPLMAKWLSEHIVEGKAVDARVDPDRLFLKWARKIKNAL